MAYALTSGVVMMAHEVVKCRGHSNILATHHTTFEITTEEHLTPAGTCIIGIGAERGSEGLSPGFRDLLASDKARLTSVITVGGHVITVHSRGSARMTLDHPTDMVWRRSSYVCGRTVGILSDHVARTIPREMIEILQKGGEMVVEMTVVIPDSTD